MEYWNPLIVSTRGVQPSVTTPSAALTPAGLDIVAHVIAVSWMSSMDDISMPQQVNGNERHDQCYEKPNGNH
jgi:hypothetical protein